MSDLVKGKTDKLEDMLFDSQNNKQRIAHIEYYLFRRLIQNRDFERVERAVTMIEDSKGEIKTQNIAREVCLGIKQFERIFSNHVGLNPKKFSSIIRFQNVLKMKREFKELSMYQLALDNGYYDQSHFNHDFKIFTGYTPRTFFNKENKD